MYTERVNPAISKLTRENGSTRIAYFRIRIYASRADQRGRWPSFLYWVLNESVLRVDGKFELYDVADAKAYHLILHCCLPRRFPIFSLTTLQNTSLSIFLPCLTVISVTISVNSSSSALDQGPEDTLSIGDSPAMKLDLTSDSNRFI